MLNWILALLVEKKLLKLADARELAKHLDTAIQARNFDDAYGDIKKILDSIEHK